MLVIASAEFLSKYPGTVRTLAKELARNGDVDILKGVSKVIPEVFKEIGNELLAEALKNDQANVVKFLMEDGFVESGQLQTTKLLKEAIEGNKPKITSFLFSRVGAEGYSTTLTLMYSFSVSALKNNADVIKRAAENNGRTQVMDFMYDTGFVERPIVDRIYNELLGTRTLTEVSSIYYKYADSGQELLFSQAVERRNANQKRAAQQPGVA